VIDMKHLHRWLAGLAVGLPLLCASAQDDEPLDRTPQDCLSVSNIDKTKVLDDQTILFYMRGKRAFRNYLPRKCPGLDREERFMYETRSNRLCSVDTITVLEQWNSRLQPGFSCRLGEFHPLTREEVEDLERIDKLGPQPDAIESHPVELPPQNAADDAAAAPQGDEADD
jgi:hypothetical protein